MKPYFNDHQRLYPGREPPFYNCSAIEAVETLEKNYEIIRSEFLAAYSCAVKKQEMFRKYTLKKQKGWRQSELRIAGVEYRERMKFFPRTASLLSTINGISTAYFSVLSPGVEIKPHVGDSDAFYRIHLGLKIPASLPECGIEVAGMQKAWEEGRCVVFNDIYCHTAWNHSSEERVVLIVDVVRKEFQDRKLYIEAGLRGTLYYSRLYEVLFPIIELMPRIITRLGNPVFRWVNFLWKISFSFILRKSDINE